jgi:hypothetical protein
MAIPTVTPISAERTLPPTIDHGWASGLLGTPNSSTADAPIGAINQILTSPNSQWLNILVTASPVPAPIDARTICFLATGNACGLRRPRKMRIREKSDPGKTLNIVQLAYIILRTYVSFSFFNLVLTTTPLLWLFVIHFVNVKKARATLKSPLRLGISTLWIEGQIR